MNVPVKAWLKIVSWCRVNCPGCGSSNVSGENGGPYSCGNCGSLWQ
jgi:ribosomal protein S27AE